MRIAPRWVMLLAIGLAMPCAAGAASAVSYDADTGTYGYSMNNRSVSAALQEALGYCAQRSSNCSNVASTSETGYSALYAGTGAMGFALSAQDDAAAQRKDEAMCRRKAGDCRLVLLWREAPAVPAVPPMRPHTLPPIAPAE